MFSKKAGFIVLAVLLLLSQHTSCKGPFTYETHPVIWVSDYTLTFSAAESGSNPTPQVLQIKNSGVENLTYTIADDADWLTIFPNSGTSTGQVIEHTVSVDKSGLASRGEPYTAKITVTSTQACNNPQQVTVTLNLSEQPPPEISVTPKNVSFSAAVGGSNPPAQTIRVRNSGQGTLNYTISDDANWLAVNPASGTSTGNEITHSLAVNVAGLSAGTYNAAVTIAASNAVNSPQTVNVTLTIGTTVPPTIAVSPTSLSFNARVGGSNPATQKIKVSNSGSGTLNYVITDDANWMSVTPASGTSTGQDVSHTVSVNIAGLSTGTYHGVITVSSPNATNSPRSVQVTLVIGTIPTNNQIGLSISGGDVLVSILGNTQQIKSFGFKLNLSTAGLTLTGVSKGSLTSSWASVAGSQSGQVVTIGGFAGDPNLAIPAGSSGTIAIIHLTGQGQICLSNLTDDIAGMTISPGCVTK
jgi:hypothetical protein